MMLADLPPVLQDHPGEMRRGLAHHQPPHGDGAGECDSVDIGPVRRTDRDLRPARHHVQDAGELGLPADLAQRQRGQRRSWRGRQYDCAAGGERGADFVDGEREGIVVGSDCAHHPRGAIRHQAGAGHWIMVLPQVLGSVAAGQLGVVAQVFGRCPAPEGGEPVRSVFPPHARSWTRAPRSGR